MSDVNVAKIADKVRKLLALAQGNPNEAEATAAAQKAQDLLAAYNLDMSVVGSHASAEETARTKDSLMGGAAEWQRQLWAAVSRLNFCLYFYERRHGKKRENGPVRLRWHHVVVGRKINVLATNLMCEYLEEAVDRLTRERFSGKDLKSTEALAYREGIADRIRVKIHKRRQEMIAEEAKKAAASAANTKNALVLANYTQAEHDANMDLLYGEGYSARAKARAAAQEKAWKEAEEAEAKWRAENPEAAKKKDAEKAAEAKKQRFRSYRESGRDRRRNSGAYYAGYEKGADVSLDKQVQSGAKASAARQLT